MKAIIQDDFFILTKDQYLNREFPEELSAGDDVRIVLDNGYYWDILPVGIASFHKPDGTYILAVYGDLVSDPVFPESYIDEDSDWFTPLEQRYFENQETYEKSIYMQKQNAAALAASVASDDNGTNDDRDSAENYF